jgi:hypothetical protein
MNSRDLTQLVKQIEMFGKNEHIQILSILQKHNVEITENNNGCFVDMTEINSSVLFEIKTFLDYINLQKNEMSDYESEKEILKNKIKVNSIIE